MSIGFFKTGRLIVSNYVRTPLRFNAILIIENIDKCCFLWSILAYLNPCEKDHPSIEKI